MGRNTEYTRSHQQLLCPKAARPVSASSLGVLGSRIEHVGFAWPVFQQVVPSESALVTDRRGVGGVRCFPHTDTPWLLESRGPSAGCHWRARVRLPHRARRCGGAVTENTSDANGRGAFAWPRA